MKTLAPTSPIVLPRDGLRRFVGPVHVQCISGTLWITIDGMPADIFLEAGAAREFACAERVLVSALGGRSTLRVRTTATRCAGMGGRLRHGLQRLLGPMPAGARA